MKKKIIMAILMLGSLILTACGNNKADDEKAAYKDELQRYYNEIYITSVSINSIDATVSGADVQLLSYLDTMSDSFLGLTTVVTPERYEPLQTVTTQAYNYFKDANTIFHEIYGTPDYTSFNEMRAEEAYSYYSQAMILLSQLGQSLVADEENNGNVPDANESESDADTDNASTLDDGAAYFDGQENPEANDEYDEYYDEEEDYVIVDEDYESQNYGMDE